MGELINAEEQFNKRSKESDNIINTDIESILELSPHYIGMTEDEKKNLVNRISDYIEKRGEKKAA